MRRVSISAGGIRDGFDIELADDGADWWAFVDLTRFAGATIAVELEGAGSAALERIHQSDEIVAGEDLYREARRPQLRFSSRRGWLNDPNGLVYAGGEYHLFYQHNPYGVAWGNMHWGHAVSTDLVHWVELPVALHPDGLGTMFSGSAVVDENDTAGLRRGPDAPLIAIYTAAGVPFSQCIASSEDRGRTWEKFSGNPVLSDVGVASRDPRVFWHGPSGRWVMVLYLHRAWEEGDAVPESNSYGVYVSPDLKGWEFASEFDIPGDTECPELFPLPVAGDPVESRWIAFGAKGLYRVGSFDGETFTPESGPHALNRGDCFYAAQTFTGIPDADGRRILIPWARSGMPPEPSAIFAGMPFNQSMGLPVELTLHGTPDGLRLRAEPVRELAVLRTETTLIEEASLAPGDDHLTGVTGELWEIEADLAVGDAATIVLEVRGEPIVYDAATGDLTCRGTTAPLEPVDDGRIRLRVFVDRTAIDIFGADGRLYMPIGADLSAGPPTLSLRAEGGTARIIAVAVHRLTSAWDHAVA